MSLPSEKKSVGLCPVKQQRPQEKKHRSSPLLRLIPVVLLKTLLVFGLCMACAMHPALHLTLYSVAHAQEPSPTPTPAVVLPDSDLKSPRVTVTTFLNSMDPRSGGKPDLERAVKTLDTSEIPELVRTEKARDIAVKLYAILNYREITPTKVPSSSNVGAIQILDVAGYGIYLERNGPNWRFSKSTVSETPAIFREVEAKLSRNQLRELSGSTGGWLTLRTYVPESLKGTTFLIEDWQWIVGVIAIALMIVIQTFIVRALRWIAARFILKRFAASHEEAFKSLGKPIFAVIFTIGLQLFLSTLDIAVEAYGPLIAWIATIRVAAIMVLAIRSIELVTAGLKQSRFRSLTNGDDLFVPLIQRALWLVVIAFGAVQILTIHGVNVSGLVAGLGLGGLAFALAAKDTVENIFGSIAILIDRPFKAGEYVIIGGVGGSVERIGLRTTRLRTPDNSLVSMPNSKVIASHVENLGARAFLRTNFTITLGYDTPLPHVEALIVGIRELLASHPLVKQDAIAVFLTSISAPGYGILIQFYLALRDWQQEQRRKEEIFFAIVRLAEQLGVKLINPTPSIDMRMLATTAQVAQADTVLDGAAAARGLKVGWNRITS